LDSPAPDDRSADAPREVPEEVWTRADRARLRDGNVAALERFYEEYFDRIYGYVRRLVGEEHMAEDLSQEIFMHIQKSLASYDPGRELRPWVFTIATNKVRDFWRSRRFRDRRREGRFEDDEGTIFVASDAREPMDLLENRELSEQVAEAVRSLPDSMGETFVLRYFEGLSFEAIGQMIDRNETAVRKRYSRALEELRHVLGNALGISPGERA